LPLVAVRHFCLSNVTVYFKIYTLARFSLVLVKNLPIYETKFKNLANKEAPKTLGGVCFLVDRHIVFSGFGNTKFLSNLIIVKFNLKKHHISDQFGAIN
jgi:hypothetical protein